MNIERMMRYMIFLKEEFDSSDLNSVVYDIIEGAKSISPKLHICM